MPKKRTFIGLSLMIVIIGGLCLLLFLLPEKEPSTTHSDEPAAQLFDRNDPDKITALSFTHADNAPLSFINIEGTWQVNGRENLAISQSNVKALLEALEYMTALRIIAEQSDSITEYGLDTPICTIRLQQDDMEKCYLFGDYNEYYAGYYCMIEGKDAVYMVAESFVDRFDLTMEDLLGSDRLPDLGNLQAVSWKSMDGSILTALPEGEHEELLTLLSTLELGKWVDYGVEQYPLFGLDTPAVAELTLWDSQKVTLSFGEGESEEFIYLRIGDSELIYLAECDDLSLLLEYVRGTYKQPSD